MLGHLDLIRELPRSFRRANLRVAYSQGFHPKPDLSFAPALSLGVPSLDEFVDATLLDPPRREELLARLKEATSSGLVFEDAGRLPERAPTLSKTIGAGRYALVVPRSLVDEIGGTSEIEARIVRFLSETSVFLMRQVDRAKKRVDVRKHVISIGFGDSTLVEYCRKAGLLGEFLPLDVLIAISPEGSSKATEVGLALFGDAGHACRAVRVALLDHAHLPLSQRFRGDVFEVEVPQSAVTRPDPVPADCP
jgi:radical SAM-linked protein